MRARRTEVAAWLPTLGFAAAFAVGCDRGAGDGSAPAGSGGPSPAVKVAVVSPARGDVTRTSEQPGQIEAAETTPIHARLGGYVESVAVDIGDAITEGQILAVLRVPEIEADLRQKRAAVREAEAERKQAEAAVEVAQAGVLSAQARVQEIESGVRRAEAEASRWRSEFARVEQLSNERALTGSLVDETRSKLHAAEAGRDEVEARVRSAGASLAEAKALLDKARADLDATASHIEVARFESERAEAMESYARILSPYEGVVIRRNVDVGHLTTPGAAGEPLFVVACSGIATIVVDVPESEASLVDVGDRARIRLQALEGKIIEGQVARTAWALDSATRSLRTEIDLPDSEGVLRPGLYAYASIIADEHKGVLTVPATAVFLDAGKSYCVTVVDGRARRNAVKRGLADGSRIEIISGLREDDQVVEANAASLADGQAVTRNEPAVEAPRK